MGAFGRELKNMSGSTIHGESYIKTYRSYEEDEIEICIKCNKKEFAGGWCNNCQSRDNEL